MVQNKYVVLLYNMNEISFIVNSSSSNGATNVSSGGDYFEIHLEDGIDIPRDAEGVNVSVEDADVWWSIPNIIAGQNDKMYVTGQNTSDVVTNFTITIPQGLYDLTGLNTAIARELGNAGAKVSPDPLISMTPDDATQKVQIRFNYNDVSIDFTQNDTPREILGYNSSIYGAYTTAPHNVLAPNTAQFNQVNYFLLHSDIVQKGIRYNNTYSQIIAKVPIDVSPGSQITYTPFNPSKIPAPELSGANRNVLRFWITDDKNRPINTNNESYSMRVVIRYTTPKTYEHFMRSSYR